MKIDKQKLNQSILKIIKETNIVSDYDLDWINFSLNRKDDIVSVECFRPLIESCSKYNDWIQNPRNEEWDIYKFQKLIEGQLNACKALYYKQKVVLLGVSQRRKYKDLLAPNLMNFVSPQSCKIIIDACYGLGFCEARSYFVEKALANPEITNICFVDDDILLPIDAIDRLLSYSETFIGGSYVKKNVTLESTATQTIKDPKFYYTNSSVPCEKDNYEAVPANAMGLGLTMIDVDFFRNLPKPWFKFQLDSNGKVQVGEDALLVQRAMISNPPIQPKIVKGIVGVHVNFQDGKHYGPECLVDPLTRRIRPEYEEYYTKFACDPKELYCEDIDKVFQR